jgi:predicted LPLAT superfamily acyltransferase
LFGQPFRFAVGPFRLASLAEVPLVPVFTARIGEGRHLVQLGEPIELPRKMEEVQLDEALATVGAQLQMHIAAFPTQWFHFRK